MFVATICSLGVKLRRRGGFLLIATTDRLDDQSHADRLSADLDAHDPAVYYSADLLNIGLELARGDAGDLGADAAKVLGLAAMGLLVPEGGFLTCEKTDAWHSITSFFRAGQCRRETADCKPPVSGRCGY